MQVLIVDDEPNISEGLAILSRRALTATDVVEFECDALHALSRLESGTFDLLMTDISMPEMDGLELTRKARVRGLVDHVVIITGYGEFSFAQQALRYGAADFLLKPVDKHELAAALVRIRTQVEQRSAARSTPADLTRSLLPGSSPPSTRDDHPGIPGPVCVIVAPLDRAQAVLRLVHSLSRSTTDRGTEAAALDVVSVERVAAVATLVPLDGAAEASDDLTAVAREWLGQDSCAGFAFGVEDDLPLHALVDRAYTAFMAARLFSSGIVVHTGTAMPADALTDDTFGLSQTDLHSAEAIVRTLEGVIDTSSATAYEKAQACRQLCRLLAARVGVMTGVPSTELTHEIDLRLLGAKTPARVIEIAAESAARTRRRDVGSGSAAERVLKAIRTAAPDELYLQAIADRLGLTPGYVSSVLKKHTGKTFAAYTNEIRMATAQRLLTDTVELTVQNVARAVGFTSPRQFYRQFRNFSGCTPTEYRSRRSHVEK